MNLPVINNSKQFDHLVSRVEETRKIINSSAAAVVIIKEGHIVTEWYSGYHHDKPGSKPVTSYSQFNVYSIRKTHIGLALAFAVVDANLNLNTPVVEFIDDISQDDLKTITIGDVLTKTKPKFFGPDKIEGEGLAARIVKKVTGKTIAQLLREKIFDPLQLKNTEWISVPKENMVCDFTAGDGYASIRIESDEGDGRNLYMTAKDLAYWGYLHLNRGVINGKQLIPESVWDISDRLKSTPPNAHKRIMGWYYTDDMFDAEGATGCHLAIIPKDNTVAVRMYNRYASTHIKELLECLIYDVSIQPV